MLTRWVHCVVPFLYIHLHGWTYFATQTIYTWSIIYLCLCNFALIMPIAFFLGLFGNLPKKVHHIWPRTTLKIPSTNMSGKRGFFRNWVRTANRRPLALWEGISTHSPKGLAARAKSVSCVFSQKRTWKHVVVSAIFKCDAQPKSHAWRHDYINSRHIFYSQRHVIYTMIYIDRCDSRSNERCNDIFSRSYRPLLSVKKCINFFSKLVQTCFKRNKVSLSHGLP